ncbi:MAG: sodium-dependent bicarbonate transport family permease [Steroidobacteraceae bacterium]|nr:sodium-dependent bicarbonate transport family permease [Steroidobacteraceae bacterium]
MPHLDPVALFFVLGLAAGLARADLKVPPAIYEFTSIVLMLSIGLRAGSQLAQQDLGRIALDIVGVFALGLLLPLLAYPVLRYVGKLDRPDAASVAAHYGAISVATFAVALSFMADRQIAFEPYAPLFVVLFDVPAILTGIVLARGLGGGSGTRDWRGLGRQVFLGKSVVLLLGGLVIGWITGPAGLEPIAPFFFDLFKGVLALFLLEMGLIASAHLSGMMRHGLFMVAFGIVTPVVFATIGIGFATVMGLSPGGSILLAVLAGSASYISVPAAMRAAVPEANPALPLTASLAITFPFNILVGIPLYHRMVMAWIGA